MPRDRDPGLPTLSCLGDDLLETRPMQRALTLARPFLLIAAYALACAAGAWWLAPPLIFLLFVAVVTSTHDVVHRSLGLGTSATSWWLCVLGALILASGHAYRATHLQHHRVFPGPDDPEGDPARMDLFSALRHGPIFLPRLWRWAFCRAPRAERAWLLGELGWALALPIAGAALLPLTPAVLLYAVMVHVGAWVFPLLTVHLPHHGYGATELTQTRTLRGRIVPALFLELTYHLEHHLYPQVPSHHLPALSRRLDPVLRAAGVVPWQVP